MGFSIQRLLSLMILIFAGFGPAQAQTIFTWNSGDILPVLNPPTLAAGDTLNIATTNEHDFNGQAIVINGTANWTGGRLRSGNAGSVTNNAAWNDSASSDYNNDWGGTAWVFTNAAGGTYTKSATGQTNFYVPFTNNGTVSIQQGTLNFNGGGVNSSTITTTTTGALTLFSTDFTLAARF